MTANQTMRIHTAAGIEDVDADRVQIEGGEYILSLGNTEVRRVAIADIVQDGEHSGIETIYSRS